MAEALRRPAISLKARVALAMAAVLVAGGIVVLAAALGYGRQAAREIYDRLLLGAAQSIAESISVRDGTLVVDMPVTAFELLAFAPDDRIRYRVTGPDGQTVTGSAAAPLPREAGETVFYDGAFGAEAARYVALTRRFAERSFSGPVTVVVGQTLLARRALARDIAGNAVAVLGAAGALIALLAWLALRSALLPLPRIGAALRGRDPTDLTPLDLSVPREVAEMLSPLNDFMARLDRQLVSNRSLIGDAAHQLRTPVAAIRAQAQLAAGEADPETRARIVARIHERTLSLSRLLDQMLSQALIAHRSDTEPRALVDLRDIALDVLEDAEAAGGVVELDLPDDPVMVRADAVALAEAGKNLLHNALRHGRGPVRLGVRGPVLYVRDNGAGPGEAVLARVGERFVGSAGGSGLGLSIAAAVAEGHGGRLRLERRAGGFEAALCLEGAA
ncbi:sensor histidine kinase [Oceaniglobus roseus]|uniref:sensor histidine kinase n=1 Tax=Oceaniglobus roseus TaxID=1737570 RepID=UPI001FE41C6B|nr:sensor histidine kinase [Kandeliimicrobium roseum]